MYLCPLSESQLNVYLDIHVRGNDNPYRIGIKTPIQNDFSVSEVKKATENIILTHPILGSRIVRKDNQPWLQTDAKPTIVFMKAPTEEKVKRFLTDNFDMDSSLSRFLIAENEGRLILYSVFHHLVFDGFSAFQFKEDLFKLLKNEKLVEDSDYLNAPAFDEGIKQTKIYDAAKLHFQKMLSGFQDISTWTPDIKKSKECYISKKIDISIDTINKILNKYKISENVLFTSVFAYTLSRFTGSNKVAFNILSNGRDRMNAHNGIGMFVNNLPVVFDFSSPYLSRFFEDASEVILNTIKYDFYPLRELVKEHGIGNSVLFQYRPYTFTNADEETLNQIYDFDSYMNSLGSPVANADFNVARHSNNYSINVLKSSLYSKSTIINFIDTYINILNGIVDETDLNKINYIEKSTLEKLDKLNNTKAPLRFKSLTEGFNLTLKSSPDSPLVTFRDKIVTYKEGSSLVWALSNELIKNNVKKNSNICIFLERSHWSYLCNLAALNLNMPYTFLEKKYPDNHLSYIINDLEAKAIFVDDSTYEKTNKILNLLGHKAVVINVNNIKDTIPLSKPLLEDKLHIKATVSNVYTSGTTGQPKAIQSTKLGIINMTEAYIEQSSLCRKDIYSIYVAFSFDVTYAAFYGCLFTGACLDIVPEETRYDIHELNKHFIMHKTTHTFITTQVAKLYLREIKNIPVKVLYTIGEKLGKVRPVKDCDFFDSYGPTETVNYASFIKVKDKIHYSSVGFANKNTSFYIIDNESRRVPFGAVGELCISGYQVTNGYHKRDALTKAVFVENIFDGHLKHYEIMYKTGDLARFLPDGSIDIIGRRDSQVKIRGNRVELGEVENEIKKIDFIKDAVVTTCLSDGNKELVAYVVSDLNEDGVTLEKNIKESVANKKPNYMVPTYVIKLDAIPLNVNGKVDKKALPKPQKATIKKVYIKPTSKYEKILCNLFQELFNVKQIGIEDDFVELGGDSLIAIKLIAQLKDSGITLADILKLRTPKLLAKKIDSTSSTDYDLYKYKKSKKIPLSESQLNVYLDIKTKTSKKDPYIIGQKIELEHYSIEQVKDALIELINKHPVLQSCIEYSNSEPYMTRSEYPSIEIIEKSQKSKLNKFLTKPFDLEKSTSRFCIALENNKTVLYCVYHHMVFDGTSSFVFKNNLFKILNGEKTKLDLGFVKPPAFDEYIKETDVYKKAEYYYEKIFADIDDCNFLAEDGDNEQFGFVSSPINIDKKIIKKYISENSIYENILFTSVFAYTLSRFVYSNKVMFAIVENDRDRLSVMDSIGMFVKTLPLLIDCSGNNNVDLFNYVSKAIASARKYDYYPYRELAKQYKLRLSVIFQFVPMLKEGCNKQSLEEIEFNKCFNSLNPPVSDIESNVWEYEDHYSLNIRYSSKHSKRFILSFADTFNKLLEGILNNQKFKNINYLTENNKIKLDSINKTKSKLKYDDVLQGFNESLEKRPDSLLVTFKDQAITYQEGASIIWSITKHLEKNKVNKKSNICILIERSHWSFLCALASLNHNCPYVFLDKKYPDDYIEFVVKELDVDAIFVDDSTYDRMCKVINNINCEPLLVNIDKIDKFAAPANLLSVNKVNKKDTATILYTSGTTGTPKASQSTRLAILNMALSYVEQTSLCEKDIYSLYVALSFDVACTGFYACLCTGACLDIIPEETRLSINKLNNHFIKHKTTHTFITTQVAKLFINQVESIPVKVFYTAGEKLGEVRPVKDCMFFDAYGPSEAVSFVSYIQVKDKLHPSSVGFANKNTRFYIADNNMRRASYGAVGELCIAGYQVANGYFKRPKETKAAFVPNTFDVEEKGYEIVYKTGDLARILKDGSIGYVGRKDSQVKIRGNRVELSEIESCIREVDTIKDVALNTIEHNGNKELAAYIVLRTNQTPFNEVEKKLKKYIEKNKPIYMVPSYFVQMEKIPFNINGKVDKKALPMPDIESSKIEYVEPRNKNEKILVEAFEKVFDVKRIGIEDSFTTLGGDSIKAIRLGSILFDKGVDINIDDILKLNTPKEIAKTVKNKRTLNYKKTEGKIGLLPIQSYYFEKLNDNKFSQLFIVESNEVLDIERLQNAFNELTKYQDILRAIYKKDKNSKIEQIIRPEDTQVTKIISIDVEENSEYKTIQKEATKSFEELSVEDNNLLRIKAINKKYLIFVAHHLIIDGISWSILLDDLTLLYKKKNINRPYPYAYWVKDVQEFSQHISKETVENYKQINNKLNQESTKGQKTDYLYKFELNYKFKNLYNITEHECLLLSVARAYKKVFKKNLICSMESHGRDAAIGFVGKTIGWFTSIYPQEFYVDSSCSSTSIIKDIFIMRRMLSSVENLGLAYLSLIYNQKAFDFKYCPIIFNLLTDEFDYRNSLFEAKNKIILDDNVNKLQKKEETIIYSMDLNIQKYKSDYIIIGSYPDGTYLADGHREFLKEIENQANYILSELHNIDKSNCYIYPLNDEQQFMYNDEISNNKDNAYSCPGIVTCKKKYSHQYIESAIKKFVDVHPVLKTRIYDKELIPLGITDSVPHIEYKKLDNEISIDWIQSMLLPFDLNNSTTHFWLLESNEAQHLVFDCHHVISDATSMKIMTESLMELLEKPELIIDKDLGFLKLANSNSSEQYRQEFNQGKAYFDKNLFDITEKMKNPLRKENAASGKARIYLKNTRVKAIELARKLGITEAHLLTSVFGLALAKMADLEKVYFTFIHNGRDSKESQNALGAFLRTVPIVLECENSSFVDFLQNSSKKIFESMKASVYPFRLLSEKYSISNHISFEYNYNLNDTSFVDVDDVEYTTDKNSNEKYMYNLMVYVNTYKKDYLITIIHENMYSKDTILKFADTYKSIFEQILYTKNLKK